LINILQVSMIRNLALAIALFAVLTTSLKESKAQLNYTVNLENTAHRYVHVTMEFEADEDETELMMAVWTPGSYLVREYARHIDSMTVTDQDGEPLSYRKTRKNRWLVETDGADFVKVSYRLYCNEESVRTNFVNHDYAVLNGAPTFITVPDRLDQEHVVTLELPQEWKRSATSLIAGDDPHVYTAENFDELVDSPIVAGNLQVYPFDVGAVPHQLVNIGEQGMWDGTKAASDLKKIVAAHQKMWGSVPYDRYLFLNVLSGGGGGLEHDNSTLVISSRWSFRDKSRYASWLSLCSHEFFHTWNVRRLRPKPLIKYDYENEIYTDGLWIAEGITSYYQDLALVRAGLLSKSRFMSGVSSEIESVQRTVGRKYQSLRDSSFDTWIKFYRPDENSRNTRISYYAKGAVAAFLLDMKIRSLTDNEKSLDDVMRKMFSKYSKKGFTSEQFRRVAGQVAGENLDDWFENAIDSTNELEFDSSLKFMGINIPKASAKMDEEKKAKKVSRSAPATIGASFSGSRISRVTPDSQAWRLGMVSGDEVVAINGFRLSGSFSDRLRQYEIGDQIELLISRDDLLFSETVTLEARKTEDWAISWRSNPSKDQKQRIAAWLETEGGQTDKKKDGDEQEEVGKSSDEAPKKKRKRRRKKPLKS
jgi:predicted metalloprotease with PDZ domain